MTFRDTGNSNSKKKAENYIHKISARYRLKLFLSVLFLADFSFLSREHFLTDTCNLDVVKGHEQTPNHL